LTTSFGSKAGDFQGFAQHEGAGRGLLHPDAPSGKIARRAEGRARHDHVRSGRIVEDQDDPHIEAPLPRQQTLVQGEAGRFHLFAGERHEACRVGRHFHQTHRRLIQQAQFAGEEQGLVAHPDDARHAHQGPRRLTAGPKGQGEERGEDIATGGHGFFGAVYRLAFASW
jgi:hypothetical protein